MLEEEKENNMLLAIINDSLLEGLREEFKECYYVEYLDVYTSHIISKKFLIENSKIINEIYLNLGDTESQEVLQAYLHVRYSGIKRIST